MAKKKKPTSNPARGFATTSTASKSKSGEVESGIESKTTAFNSSQPQQRQNPQAEDEPKPRPGAPEKKFGDLSPEELEQQLEESELQNLLDAHGERIKKDAVRQSANLKKECRLLRPQADHLRTRSWLPPDLVQLIVDRVDSKEDRAPSLNVVTSATKDDLLLRVWTLHQLLPKIGFSSSERQSALAELVGSRRPPIPTTARGSKEFVWGLQECLDWLATSSDARYDVTDPGRLMYTEPDKSEAPDPGTSVSPSNQSRPATPPGLQASESPATASDADTSQDSLLSNSESESDMEPDDMIRKYVSLQMRRFKIDPLATEKQSNKASKAVHHPSSSNPRTNKTRHIDAKINKLKADVLFDQYEAEKQWGTIRIDLIQEAAERKRLGMSIQNVSRGHGETSHIAHDSKPSDETQDDEDGDILLDDLFSSLPEISIDADTGASRMTTTDSGGMPIKIRDFGKWNGIAPRRILEEACKARDSSSRVQYKLLSESSFSNRQSVGIRWSRPQDRPSVLPLEGFSCESQARLVEVGMRTISCPTTIQSEAYVSTVALFFIFSSSPKEEKASLRLPPVWRDLWRELWELKKSQSDSEERNTLRELQVLIVEHSSTSEQMQETLPSSNKGIYRDGSDMSKPASEHVPTSAAVSDSLKALWASKSSTPSYQAMLVSRKSLPIWDYKSELLDAFVNHQVVIVCGETGCGKSTQVPAYILEEEMANGRYCKVFCTEPRRISAISLARRVSEELGEKKGDVGTTRSLVGYAIRLESQTTPQTKLIYATTGIVMRMLESSSGLEDITHLVLDEVHERSIESDFLLIVLKKLMITRPNLKVILMSATVDAARFSAYLDEAPILTVPGRTFSVDVKFLEDAVEVTKFGDSGASGHTDMIDDDEDEENEEAREHRTTTNENFKAYSTRTRETLTKFDEYRISYDLIVKLLETIATSLTYTDYSKAILIFLPGIAEIRRLNDMLIGNRVFAHGWNIHPLHSTIATDEQERAFLVPPPGTRKIVIATNIAETGITIPDVTCVIDTGKHKEMRFDERRQLSRLIESFISRANAKQRRGRAGRVQKGLCFHLFTKHRHDSIMPLEQTPEMLRLSLQDLVLRVKVCKLGDIAQILSEALDPPSAKNVQRAIDALVDVKALTVAQDLTPLGRQLARLPLDVFLGKLILLGTIFGCLDATTTIAAILSSKSPFSAPMGARAQADLAKAVLKKGDSDLLTVYNAYCSWRRICNANATMSEQQFCRKNFLSPQTLSNIEELKSQLLAALVDAGFVALNQAEKTALNRVRSYSRQRHFVPTLPQYSENDANELILNSVIAWSFYPKLIKREGKGWRNIANNQSVSLHPTSVNKGVERPPKWLSFYHIMQSSNKYYNAHECSAVEDFAIIIGCGEVEFKMFSGVIIVDGNRIRFAVDEWKKMLAIRSLRTEIRKIMSQSFQKPGRPLTEKQQGWMNIWQQIFARDKIE